MARHRRNPVVHSCPFNYSVVWLHAMFLMYISVQFIGTQSPQKHSRLRHSRAIDAASHASNVINIDVAREPFVNDGLPCDSEIYCYGDILTTVHRLKLFNDSKTFVDKPLLADSPPNKTLEDFRDMVSKEANGSISSITRDQMWDFIGKHFEGQDADLPVYTPPDWSELLPFADKIRSRSLRDFAQILHGKWRDLGRNISINIREHQELHSLIYVPHPFIVPGGRYDEIYYWDSFWVMQGLLASNMTYTAKGMLRNFAYLIKQFGHIPNGNRVYYKKRSQPPLFAMMIEEYRKHPYVDAYDAKALIEELLPQLEDEHHFWTTYRVAPPVIINGTSYTLNIFKGGIKHPRPESFWEDVQLARLHALNHTTTTKLQDEKQLFANIAAGAESGLDFSTRWLDTPDSTFDTIRTETIIPVDLNAFLCAQENLLANFYQLIGNNIQAERYSKLALDRSDAIQNVLWSEKDKMWRDYDLQTGKQRPYFYINNMAPIFAKCNGRNFNVTGTAFVKQVMSSKDIQEITNFPGGFPVSLYHSETDCCQWDLPNAWPPHQLMMIEGFGHNQDAEVQAMVISWAQKWVTAVHGGFRRHGNLYEKYNAREAGTYGYGGEYEVQLGFGWTNGGVMRLLELYPNSLVSSYDNSSSSERLNSILAYQWTFTILVVIAAQLSF